MVAKAACAPVAYVKAWPLSGEPEVLANEKPGAMPIIACGLNQYNKICIIVRESLEAY